MSWYTRIAQTMQKQKPHGWPADISQWVITNDGNGYRTPAWTFNADCPASQYQSWLQSAPEGQTTALKGRQFIWYAQKSSDDNGRPIISAVAWAG